MCILWPIDPFDPLTIKVQETLQDSPSRGSFPIPPERAISSFTTRSNENMCILWLIALSNFSDH